MKMFLDTSVLLAALVRNNPSHVVSRALLQLVVQKQVVGYTSTHVLAELYAKLTGIPFQPRIHGHEAQDLLDNMILPNFEFIALSTDGYKGAINHAVEQGIVGGALFDALILLAAIHADADWIVTFNAKDFRRIRPELAKRVVTPLDLDLGGLVEEA
ncbi:PIN domain-containing protein [bacterium]|nr:PIN domain-containing protein [bacterium]